MILDIFDTVEVVSSKPLRSDSPIVSLDCPSSEFFGELGSFRNGGSGSVSV